MIVSYDLERFFSYIMSQLSNNYAAAAPARSNRKQPGRENAPPTTLLRLTFDVSLHDSEHLLTHYALSTFVYHLVLGSTCHRKMAVMTCQNRLETERAG